MHNEIVSIGFVELQETNKTAFTLCVKYPSTELLGIKETVRGLQ
jgi:hypothetical protein